jgi:hypothetical protein
MFCKGVQHHMQFCSDHLNCVKMVVFSVGETEKSLGVKTDQMDGWGMTVMVSDQKIPW